MTVSVRKQWKHFKASPSGRRFQIRHRLRRARSGGPARTIMICTLGVIIMLAGVAMLVLPGPGIVTIVIGAAFIAEESLFVSRWLDRLDHWGTRHYQAWQARRAARG